MTNTKNTTEITNKYYPLYQSVLEQVRCQIDYNILIEERKIEKLGTNECMIKAVNAVMEETGSRIEPATVERVLRFNAADIPEKYTAIGYL